MGRGIAVAFAYAGHAVTMIDVKARSAEQFAALEAEALGEVRKTLASLARFGLLADKDAETVIARVSVVPRADWPTALAGAGIVFEGVPEVVELKREVLAAASKCVGTRRHHRLDHVDHSGRRYLAARSSAPSDSSMCIGSTRPI